MPLRILPVAQQLQNGDQITDALFDAREGTDRAQVRSGSQVFSRLLATKAGFADRRFGLRENLLLDQIERLWFHGWCFLLSPFRLS